MPTLEERLAALEGKYGTLDETLQSLFRRLDILTNVGLKKEMYDREMAENMTMLLGMVSEQQRDGREGKAHQERLEAQITSLDSRVANMERGIAALEVRMGTMETGFNAKLDAIIAMLNKGTP